ncbi:hypothetical protein, partial [Pusillimonas sp. T2]|uniref:hypothetical protein n=1 Tax=Pusillimonas sp. T2 TaxID=1548123 RepID=UPI001C1FFAF2
MNSKQSSAKSAEEAQQSVRTFHAPNQGPIMRLNDPLIVAQNNELGLRLEAIGQHRYKPADFDGISLVTFTKERKSF